MQESCLQQPSAKRCPVHACCGSMLSEENRGSQKKLSHLEVIDVPALRRHCQLSLAQPVIFLRKDRHREDVLIEVAARLESKKREKKASLLSLLSSCVSEA